MKRRFTLAVTAAVLFAFVLCACPPEDSGSESSQQKQPPKKTIKKVYDGELDYLGWFFLLWEIANQNDYIDLDLSDCTLDPDNKKGGLCEEIIDDGSFTPPFPDPDPRKYIAFDPYPSFINGKEKIVSITLPKEATMIIGTNIPDGKETPDNWAFRHFTNLRSVTGENVNLIGKYAFYNCKTLEKVDFPHVSHAVSNSELTDPNNDMINGFRVDIGHNAFENCTALTDVSIPNATVIGRSAFKGCTNLKILNFSHVWMIAQNAFEGCTGLTEVEFGNVTKIGNEAFKNCTRLVSAAFPATRRNTPGDPPPLDGEIPNYASIIFYDRAFYGCKALKKLDVRNAWNVYFCIGALANIGETLELLLFDSTTALEAYGHPQLANCFGVDDPDNDNYPQTLETITLKVPIFINSPNIDEETPGNIAHFIKHYDPEITVDIQRNL